MSHKYMARAETLSDLEKLNVYEEVDWGYGKVSRNPLVSFGHVLCNALVFYYNGIAALSHIIPEDKKGNTLTILNYSIDQIIKEMEALPHQVKAMVIGGKDPEKVRKYCQDKGVEVVFLFQDDMYRDSKGVLKTHSRDVLVIPNSKEVRIYTHKGRINKSF